MGLHLLLLAILFPSSFFFFVTKAKPFFFFLDFYLPRSLETDAAKGGTPLLLWWKSSYARGDGIASVDVDGDVAFDPCDAVLLPGFKFRQQDCVTGIEDDTPVNARKSPSSRA